MLINTENILTVQDEKTWKKEDKNEKKQEEEERLKTSYWDALVHMFRGTVGTGILALPAAFNQVGYLGGTMGVILVMYVVNYCSVILAECQLELLKRTKSESTMTYQGTIEAAFDQGPECAKKMGSFFKRAANMLLLFGQTAGNCSYILFIVTNLKEVLDPFIGTKSLVEYIAMVAPFILITNMVISLKRMALVSMFGNTVMLISVTVMFYYFTQNLPTLSERRMFGNPENIPNFVGTAYFASGCITLLLPLQNSMKKPEQMSSKLGLININSLLTGTLYVVFGFLGYLKYGDEAQKGTVTVNLPQSSVSAIFVQVSLSMSIMTATAVANYVTVDLIWEDYLSKMFKKKTILMEYLLRVAIVLSIVLGAMIVQDLKKLISVLGIIGQCTLMSTMPCIIHFLTYYNQPNVWSYIKLFYMDVIVLLFNIFILVFELTNSFKSIVST